MKFNVIPCFSNQLQYLHCFSIPDTSTIYFYPCLSYASYILDKLLNISHAWCYVQVASLAAVTVICFTSSAVLSLVTNIPVCCCFLQSCSFALVSIKCHLSVTLWFPYFFAVAGSFVLAFGSFRLLKQFCFYISLLFYRYANYKHYGWRFMAWIQVKLLVAQAHALYTSSSHM